MFAKLKQTEEAGNAGKTRYSQALDFSRQWASMRLLTTP